MADVARGFKPEVKSAKAVLRRLRAEADLFEQKHGRQFSDAYGAAFGSFYHSLAVRWHEACHERLRVSSMEVRYLLLEGLVCDDREAGGLIDTMRELEAFL